MVVPKRKSPISPASIAGLVFLVGVTLVGALFAVGQTTNLLPKAAKAGTRYKDQIFKDIRKTDDITYITRQHYGQPEDLKLDIYMPNGDTLPNRPVIILLPGGGFVSDNREMVTGYAQYFAQLGYVTIRAEYTVDSARSSPYRLGTPGLEAAIAAAQADGVAVVRWVKAHAAEYQMNPQQVIIAGGSAGAVTALQVTYDGNHSACTQLCEYSPNVLAAVSISGGVLDPSIIEAGEPPVMLFHGGMDHVVPLSLAQGVKNRADAVGVPAQLIIYPYEGHGVQDVPGTREKMAQFLFPLVSGQQSSPLPSVNPTPTISSLPSVSPSPEPSVSPKPGHQIPPKYQEQFCKIMWQFTKPMTKSDEQALLQKMRSTNLSQQIITDLGYDPRTLSGKELQDLTDQYCEFSL